MNLGLFNEYTHLKGTPQM